MNKYNLVTIKEAMSKACPYKFIEKTRDCPLCEANACMAWIEKQRKIEREDHSGGALQMASLASDRGARVRRKGGPGCMGVFVLDARGYCGRIHQSYDKDKEGY